MITELIPEFHKHIPLDLVDGVLYISYEYSTGIHLCPCGCKNKIVTPFGPNDWNWFALGESMGIKISITPSISNYQLPCKTHYYITENKVKMC